MTEIACKNEQSAMFFFLKEKGSKLQYRKYYVKWNFVKISLHKYGQKEI